MNALSKIDTDAALPLEEKWSFYVYVHTRTDTGQVFYVGKGRDGRAYSNHGRNDYWKRVVEKHGREVHVVFCGDEEMCFDVERMLIASYRADGAKLVNATDGGEGRSGYVFPDHVKAQIAASNRATKADPVYRQRSSEVQSQIWSQPDRAKQRSKTLTELWQTEGHREKTCAAIKIARQKPEFRAAIAAIKRKRNTDDSPMVGIWINKSAFSARIEVDDKRKHLGTFGTLAEAQAARRAAELKYWGPAPSTE